ncbi:MAG: hypothetical protein ACYC0X_25665 [Pirellulaceae bacterium]
MPTTQEGDTPITTRIAHNPGGRDFPFLRPRSPFGRHTFYGGNTLLTQVLLKHADALDVRAATESLQTHLAAARAQLQHHTARVEIRQVRREDGRLIVAVLVENLAGHKLPTGYPSRRVWVRLQVKNAAGQIVFCSGQCDTSGRLVDATGTPLACEWAGGPILAHASRIEDAARVQVYESVMADPEGRPTFQLLRGANYLKDNRLLPRGWSATHPDAVTTMSVGTGDDRDFVGGSDEVIYAISEIGAGPWEVQATLLYQPISARHVDELLQIDTPQVTRFRTLLSPAVRLPETLAHTQQQIDR